MKNVRNRSWRRCQYRLKRRRGMGSGSDELFKPEKKWKHMYLRVEKLKRARQLGIDYPRKSNRQLLDIELPFDD